MKLLQLYASFIVIFFGAVLHTSESVCKVKNTDSLLTFKCEGYQEMPKDADLKLEVETDVITTLDMSEGNKITQLTNLDFKTGHVMNIQKLTLSNCQMRQIEDEALVNLKSLTVIDLSNNHFKDVHLQIFKNNTDLTWINLGNNKNLAQLTGEFPEIKSLAEIYLNKCNLSRLHENTFRNLYHLKRLYLNGNSLITITPKLNSMYNLDTLTLGGNPWNCNCHFREFVKGYKKRLSGKSILITQEKPTCSKPAEFSDKPWDSVDPDEFFCDPKIEKVLVNDKIVLDVNSEIYNYESGENITISCEIWADPPADINWQKNEKPVQHLIEVSYSKLDNRTRISTLKIFNSENRDTGSYKCSAENLGRVVKRIIAVNITEKFVPLIPPVVTAGAGAFARIWLWVLIGVLCIAIIGFIIAGVVFIVLRKQKRQHNVCRKEIMEKFKNSQNVLDPENNVGKKDDKTPLLNEIGNDTPKSIPSISGTETARFSHVDFRSPEPGPYLASMQMQRSVPPSPTGYSRMVSSRPGSSQSVFLDAESRRQAFQNSNPKIDMSFDAVRYHHRPPSVDSFTSLPAPETHRYPSGYVTLPRRPRNPRWSTSTSMTDDNYYSLQRPLTSQSMGAYSTLPYKRQHQRPSILRGVKYDTVGPRTTADGGSTLSLNKITGGSMSALDSINTALNTSPTRGKITTKRYHTPSATTPGSARSAHNNFSFDPIEEVESTPATSEINIYVKPKKDESNAQGPKYKKKKPPNMANLNRAKFPSNFHQRISEINKSFERPKSATYLSKEKEINDTTDSEKEKGDPRPPPKPMRTISAPEHMDSLMYGVIQEEVEGTAV